MTTTMIRTAKLALALAVPVLLAAGSGKKSPTADPLPVGSFWVGTGEQVGPDGARVAWDGMVLHIHERKDSFFDGAAWYPGFANGVARISGVLDGAGGIKVQAPSIVYGEWPKTPGGIVAGGTWVGRIDSKGINASGSFKDPQSGAVSSSSFWLLRAPMPESKPAPSKAK